MKKYRNPITMSSSVDEIYNEYQNRVFGKSKYLRSKGIYPKPINLMRKESFRDAFTIARKENRKLSASAIVDKIVSKQLRVSSMEQAMNVVRQSKKVNNAYSRQYSLVEVLYGDSIWEEIKNVYHSKKEEGLSSVEAKHYIAMSFFGSN